MKVDWFTVIAQVINFLILVWLLKRFLYKPILNAIDEREKKINTQLADAESKKAEAKIERDEFIEKNEDFDAQRRALMNQAKSEVKLERERLLKEARRDADHLRAKREEALKEMQDNLNEEYKQNIQREVLTATKKTLADLANVHLEEQSVHTFIKRLKELSEAERNAFIQSFTPGLKPVLVQSAFDLTPDMQNSIKSSVDKILGTDTPFQFKIKPDLISGIELTANGYKLAWNIAEYLHSLERNISETMKEGG